MRTLRIDDGIFPSHFHTRCVLMAYFPCIYSPHFHSNLFLSLALYFLSTPVNLPVFYPSHSICHSLSCLIVAIEQQPVFASNSKLSTENNFHRKISEYLGNLAQFGKSSATGNKNCWFGNTELISSCPITVTQCAKHIKGVVLNAIFK